MMGNSQNTVQPTQYEKIKQYHNDAYRTIEEAIALEEHEKPVEAVEKYKEGIHIIDKCLNFPITFPETPDDNWESACRMIQKMKKTRGEVLTRINSIQSSPDYFEPVQPPPSYDEAMASERSSSPQTYTELAAALNNLQIDSVDGAQNLLYTHDNVQLYFISPSGEVRSTSELQTLNIILIEEGENERPRAVLQVGNWVYPLVPGVSPCYRTDYGAFILPDVHMEQQGYSIGIILPPEADGEVYELLENILHGIVNQTPIDEAEKRKRRAASISSTISTGLTTGASYLSKGLVIGARKTGDLINYGTPKLINSIRPNQEPPTIHPTVKKSIKVAQNASSTAANVTGFVAGKVGLATSRLGQYLAPHIRKQGTRLLKSGFRMSEEEASSKVEDVLTVAAGALEGFSTVYRGLETSAGILGDSLRNSSVQIIQHKYGNSAAELANDSFLTAGNVWDTAHNAKLLTPKGLAKCTAKQTGRALVTQDSMAARNQQHIEANEATTSNYVPPSLKLVETTKDFNGEAKGKE